MLRQVKPRVTMESTGAIQNTRQSLLPRRIAGATSCTILIECESVAAVIMTEILGAASSQICPIECHKSYPVSELVSLQPGLGLSVEG